jgi:transcriptional regulator with XRE-family HTH domain
MQKNVRIPPSPYRLLIREFRERSGETLAELSARSGVPLGTLSGYEHGRNPRVAHLMALARAFRVDLADLISSREQIPA